jgi:pimeloyl-ACP methyl ester carboxylesterase
MTTVDVPGAGLYRETRGSGPLLVMVAGASGVADSFRALAEELADRYTVLTYDRRGFSRSRLDGAQDHDHRLGTDADDVRRLIEHAGGGPATVFGASSGAVVALAALVRHPSAVARVVAFEPPLLRLLPDGPVWAGIFAELYDRYRRDGVEAALHDFRQRTFPAGDNQLMARAPRHDANAAYWFEHELRQYPLADPDLPALARLAGRIVPAAGRDGAGYPAHDATVELGRRLDRPVLELPGGHLGFHAGPAAFARALAPGLDGTLVPGSAVLTPDGWNGAYAGSPHWDLGRPQPAFQALADAGGLRGRVLDAGCSTGEHVLMAAALGLDATGVDLAPAALDRARRKAGDRGLAARFLRCDARALTDLGETFDTVLDCGLFHVLTGADRTAYVGAVRAVLRPGGRHLMLCLSDRQAGDPRPHRVGERQLRAAFATGWRLDAIEPVTLDSSTDPAGMAGWLVTATRA